MTYPTSYCYYNIVKGDLIMAKRSSSQRAYFGLDYIISLILAIIPVTSWILGIVVRFSRGNILGGILNIPFGFIFWIIDLVTMITDKDLTVLA